MKFFFVSVLFFISIKVEAQDFTKGIKVKLSEDAIYWEKLGGPSLPFKQDSVIIFKHVPNTIMWTCLYKNQLVYTSTYYLQSSGRFGVIADSLQKIQDKINTEKSKKESEEFKSTRYKSLILKYGKIYAKLVYNQEVRIGMTKKMVIDSWGEPSKINRTVTESVTEEQWIYSDSYLYFTNGKLTAFQDEQSK